MPLDGGKVGDKKVVLHFAVKFWLIVVLFRLGLTLLDNILTLYKVTLVSSFLAGYDIDLAALIR